MNSKQNSIYTMVRQVIDFLNDKQPEIKDIVGLLALQIEATNALSEIVEINDKQQTDSSIITTHKAMLRVDAGAKSINLNNKLLALATIQGDSILAQKCSYTVTAIQKLNDNEFVTACEQLLRLGHENLEALAVYKITSETLSTIGSSINAFVIERDKPQEVRNELKQYTAQLATAFSHLLSIFDKMDIVIEAIKNEYPDFYNRYQDNRNINYRHGSIKAQGSVVDAQTGNAIVGANVSFVLDGTEVLIKTSSANGGYKIKSMDEGKYSVIITKTGYQSQTITVYITGTELVNVDVKMVHA